MITKFFSIVFLTCFFTNLNAQTPYPQGVYMSIEEIQNKTPSKEIELIVEKRSKSDIKMSGGNDYRLISEDKSVSKKDIRKHILAYSNNDTLFINCTKYKLQNRYAPVRNNGRFLLFTAGIAQDTNTYNYQIEETKTATFWSDFGAIGGGIQGIKLALLRFPYLLDTKNNTVTYLNTFALRKLLADHDLALLQKYDEEKKSIADDEKEKALLTIKYVQSLNDF
ncbi:DUF6563 family protein [Zobellia alginiliquefaciens]|uniref:DUF6563 family protein n=1 Tax=Zobellia alginiliquefaciens TaxID=3032586 RepID=UPI0023E3C41C|nr:DUF6563 family protein [Zobellia alginiliquefaciens]